MASLILLLEENLEIIKKIADELPHAEDRIEVFSNVDSLVDFANHNTPSGIFIAYNSIAEQPEKIKSLCCFPLYVYAETFTIQQKLNLYNFGVTRVVRLSDTPPRELYNLLQIHEQARLNIVPLYQKSITQGGMNGEQFRKILGNGLQEKKNVIFKISDGDWKGKLRLFQGEITESVAPGKEGNEGVLAVIQHPRGRFRMRNFEKETEVYTGTVSSQALLAEADYQASLHQKLVEEFGEDELKFKVSDESDYFSMEDDEREILSLLKEANTLQNVFLRSGCSRLKTMRALEKFYDLGLIEFMPQAISKEGFSTEDLEVIGKKFFKSGRNDARVAFLGFSSDLNFQMVRNLAQQFSENTKTTEFIEFARLKIAEDLSLISFALKINSHFQKIFEKISDGLTGIVICLNSDLQENLDYNKYLLKQLFASVPVQYVAVVDPPVSDDKLSEIARTYEIPDNIEILNSTDDPGLINRQIFHKSHSVHSGSDN